MAGIMQVSTSAATGPGVADLAIYPDAMPAFGWTHRWEAYAATSEAGQTVTTLKDLIGTSHLTLNGVPGQTGATAPTVEVDVDGRYVVRFDAATERLSAAHAAPVGSPFTYVAVFRCITPPVSPNIGIVMASAVSAEGSLYLDATAARLNGGSTIGSGPAFVAGQLYVIIAVVNGASSVLRVSGRAEVTGNAGTGNPGSLNVGAGSGGAPSSPLNMDFIAGMITPQALTLTQRNQLEAALKASHKIP